MKDALKVMNDQLKKINKALVEFPTLDEFVNKPDFDQYFENEDKTKETLDNMQARDKSDALRMAFIDEQMKLCRAHTQLKFNIKGLKQVMKELKAGNEK